tara:strand:- start:2784 stop:3050 length:267 start_codon:yes stop_codon:yes gene_type:complete
MIFRRKGLLDLATRTSLDMSGHISSYELSNGNTYNVFFIEARYFGAEEICLKTGKIIREYRASNEYDYKIDFMFKDSSRLLMHKRTFK